MENNTIVTIVLIVVFAAAGFFGGMQYQKSQATAGRAGFQRGQFGARTGANRPVVGQILSSDANSITVKMADGSTKLVIVSSSTSINKAATATKSDLTNGAMVAVFGTTNSDGSVTAQNVQLNPMLRGFGGPRPSGTQ